MHRHGDALHKCFEGQHNGLKTTASLFDPWKLPSWNDLDWAVLLFVEIKQLENRRQACNWRLLNALSRSAIGPDPQTHPVVFKRLMEGWLAHQSDPAAIRDCLLVAMRWWPCDMNVVPQPLSFVNVFGPINKRRRRRR